MDDAACAAFHHAGEHRFRKQERRCEVHGQHPLPGRNIGFHGTTFGDADLQWFGFLVGNVARIEGNVAALGVVVVCVVLLVFASWFQRRYVDTNWIPGGESTKAPADEGVHAHGAA